MSLPLVPRVKLIRVKKKTSKACLSNPLFHIKLKFGPGSAAGDIFNLRGQGMQMLSTFVSLADLTCLARIFHELSAPIFKASEQQM